MIYPCMNTDIYSYVTHTMQRGPSDTFIDDHLQFCHLLDVRIREMPYIQISHARAHSHVQQVTKFQMVVNKCIICQMVVNKCITFANECITFANECITFANECITFANKRITFAY